MMKPTSLGITAAIIALSFTADGSNAFTIRAYDSMSEATARSQPRCFLHPSQAADLEAVAYDLMKEAVEEKARANALSESLSRDLAQKIRFESTGPVSWCRRKLWPFQRGEAGDKLP